MTQFYDKLDFIYLLFFRVDRLAKLRGEVNKQKEGKKS